MSGAPRPPPELVRGVAELQPAIGKRDLFTDLRPLVYTNHAGIAPVSAVVKRAVATMLTDYAKHGADAFPTWMAQRRRLKGKLATLLGASEAEIALTHNTSRGLFDVAMALPWQKGERVVVFRGEFPANVLPWQHVAELFGLELVWLDADLFRTDAAAGLAALAEVCRRPIAACAVSAVEFQTGFTMPLAAMSRLVHEASGVFVVDAVQACGVVPIDVGAMGIDYLACGSHKWMLGIEGGGFVYASAARSQALVPRTAGWLSLEGATEFLFEGPSKLRYDRPVRRAIDWLEGANVSASAFVALEASLDLLQALGVDAIHAHVLRFGDALEAEARRLGFVSLRSEDPAGRSGSVCLEMPEGIDVVAMQRRMSELGVACALPDGKLRFSPHFWNALDEVDQVVLSLEQALRELSGGAR